mmetsp:Transcript_74968/g.223383  ORF Transcript_74968/g.223383 Transcript_74968/m.223383 type:complete len:571 (-) Transcript_74968:33-1745(-)
MSFRVLGCLLAASLRQGAASQGIQEWEELEETGPRLHLQLPRDQLQRLGRRGRSLLRKSAAKLRGLPRVVQAAVAAGAGSLLLPTAVETSHGMVRGLRFWMHALPIYLDYRLLARKLRREGDALSQQERAANWQTLHEKHAPNILRMIVLLRGFYVKLGQVCSTRTDMFPKPWIEELEHLQGGRPDLLARPISAVRRIVRRDLGRRADLLVKVEETPVGAAATGQVHRARLQDGREVVVKVQYPEAESFFRQDFTNTKLFCRLLQPEHLSYLEELEAQFATEFNYIREAENLAVISANFEEGIGNPYAEKVRIPKPVPELCSRNIVVMDFLPGETLLSYAKRLQQELERSSLLWRLWRSWFVRRELQDYLSLLINVQGYQIFTDGVFNGDPHPGNVLVMPDGRLGLIDYGNVKHLSLEQRADLGRLIIALADETHAAVCAAATRLGFRTRHGNQDALFRYARLWFDRDDKASITLPGDSSPDHVQVYLERLTNLDPLDDTPQGFLMAARSSFLMRGIGTHLGVSVRMAKRWRPFAEAAVQAAAEDSSGEAPAFALGGRKRCRGAAAVSKR